MWIRLWDFEEAIVDAGFAAFTNQDGGNHRYVDGEVDFEKFRGDFLNDFDYVLIYSHGFATETFTRIATSHKVSDKTPYVEESLHNSIRRMDVRLTKTGYWSVTPDYVKATLNSENFTGTQVFLAACESTKLKDSVGSFVKMFEDNGTESITDLMLLSRIWL